MAETAAGTKETEEQRVKGERKKLKKEAERDEVESSGRGKSSGGKKRGPYKKKGGGGGGGRRQPSPEELKALGKCYDDFMKVVRILGDSEAEPKEKEKATSDYLQSAGKLLFLKYAWWLLEHSEELNFAAAGSLWGGYRVKRWYNEQSGGMGLMGLIFSGMGGGGGEPKDASRPA